MGACTALGCVQQSSTQGKVGYWCIDVVYVCSFPAPSPLNLCLTNLLLCSACSLCHLVLTRAILKERSL